nr:glycoprotein Xg-like [Mirounga angustirostris]
MESRWGLFCITVLGLLMHIQGQRDFDLADALDDPEPTKKPSSGEYGRTASTCTTTRTARQQERMPNRALKGCSGRGSGKFSPQEKKNVW